VASSATLPIGADLNSGLLPLFKQRSGAGEVAPPRCRWSATIRRSASLSRNVAGREGASGVPPAHREPKAGGGGAEMMVRERALPGV
jgi:hypothetical protein